MGTASNSPVALELGRGALIAVVLIFALSPYSGLYNHWSASDILTVIAVLASWAGPQLSPLRSRFRQSSDTPQD